jgi:hypothetical protein
MAHIVNSSVDALDEMFSKGVINAELWPLWSPDLNLCDFHLQGTLKDIVYWNNLHALKENINHEISAIPI